MLHSLLFSELDEIKPKRTTAKLLRLGKYDPEGEETIRDPYYVSLGLHDYAPNFEKVDGAYCFWSVRACVGACVTLFVPTVTFKPLKLES